MAKAWKKTVNAVNNEILMKLLGAYDENLETVAKELSVSYAVRENSVEISGDREENVLLAAAVLEKLADILLSGEEIDRSRIIYCIELQKEGKSEDIEKVMRGVIAVTARGRQIRYKTLGQKNYVEAIRHNPVTFAIGPAGTGKTYLAVALAVAAYKNKEVERIVLTRPAVEAGEKLGFLPGDLQEKVDPYLRPLYDALSEMFGQDTYMKLMERGVIEIAPLAYMRGRTLSDAFIILDEAQNTTREQMKMFLTRMGENSRVVVTGDVTQIDLPDGKGSGLTHAADVLKEVEGVAVVRLTAKDVVRHELVMRIVRAYELAEREKAKEKTNNGAKNAPSKEEDI